MSVWSIVKKELIDALRDRRALLAAFSFALVGPVIVVVMINFVAAAQRDEARVPFRLCGANNAPDLVAYLTATRFELDDSAEVCLDIPADFKEQLAAGRTAQLVVVGDLNANAPAAAALEREIESRSFTLAVQRLIARGHSPSIVRPIEVERQSTNPVADVAWLVGNGLVAYFLFAPFLIVYAMAGDLSAGERERHSLEPLLTHPVRALDVVVGKLLALAAVNIAGTAACVGVSLALLERSAMAELGVRVATTLSAGATVTLWLAPLCVLVAAVQLALGLFSKTVKEAQQIAMLMSFTPMVVLMALATRQDLEIGPWPLVWEMKALAGPLLGSTTALPPFALVAALEIVAAALILVAAARRLRSESVLG